MKDLRKKQLPPVKVTEEEFAKIAAKAQEVDLTLSGYIRFVLLNAEIKIETIK